MPTRLGACLLASALLCGVGACGKLASRDRVQSIQRMNEGIKLQQKGNMSSAERALKEATQADPTHARAYYTLGQVYRKEGKLVDAEKAFRHAVENAEAGDPIGDYHYQLGTVIAAQGDAPGVPQSEKEAKYAEAIAAFEDAVKADDKHYKALYRVGTLHEALDQPEKADAAYRKAINLNPTYSASFVSLGNMYIDYGFANVGESVLKTGAQVNDKDAAMWNGLGRAQLALNKPQEAVDSFNKASAIDPDMADVLFGLGMAYVELRQPDKATDSLQKFLRRAGADVPEDRKRAASSTIDRIASGQQ